MEDGTKSVFYLPNDLVERGRMVDVFSCMLGIVVVMMRIGEVDVRSSSWSMGRGVKRIIRYWPGGWIMAEDFGFVD